MLYYLRNKRRNINPKSKIFGNNSNVTAFSTGGGFDPFTYDPINLLCGYEGDTLTTDPANTWSDSSGNGHNLNLFNAPTIITPAVNGHDALRFDGVNQYGSVLTPIRNNPQSVYIVLKQLTWGNNRRILEGGAAGGQFMMRQAVSTPRINIFNNGSANVVTTNPDIALNVYGILTAIYEGIGSSLRTNDDPVPPTNTIGTNNGAGLTICSASGGGSSWANIEIAFIIIRNGIDTMATRNQFVDYLKTRYAI